MSHIDAKLSLHAGGCGVYQYQPCTCLSAGAAREVAALRERVSKLESENTRLRGELERGVDVRRLLKEWSMDSGTSVESMSRALRAQNVRVVEDGKEGQGG